MFKIQSYVILECPKDHYICPSKSCIHQNEWCNSVNSCNNQSEAENFCNGKLYIWLLLLFYIYQDLNIIIYLNYVHVLAKKMYFMYLGISTCPKHQFTCKNKRCTPHWSKCDGNNDCGDFSDETYPCAGRNQYFVSRIPINSNL